MTVSGYDCLAAGLRDVAQIRTRFKRVSRQTVTVGFCEAAMDGNVDCRHSNNKGSGLFVLYMDKDRERAVAVGLCLLAVELKLSPCAHQGT